MERHSRPLSLCHVNTKSIIINRAHMFIHAIALIILIRYRASFFFTEITSTDTSTVLAWLLIFLAELIMSISWLLNQAYRWRPLTRTAFPERLPEDSKLPPIDVFVCTADPDKEPTMEVMNTVISAMTLDYPPEKVHVYLSDDGGSPLTLYGMREAYDFARWWLPFCKRFGIKTRCPKAYFMNDGDEEEEGDNGVDVRSSVEYDSEKQNVKEKYELFKARVNEYTASCHRDSSLSSRDHPSSFELIRGSSADEVVQADQQNMPLLVYVAREKRPSHHHHFKAGALNVLLRVSGVISNSPYVLVLDCDMYCNDPSSARQAMCFHLDPKISPLLSFVQFPQRFHNINENDIYDGKLRSYYWTSLCGMDGLKGPVLSGTGFYIKRESLNGKSMHEGTDAMDLRKIFGNSNEFIKYLQQNDQPSNNVTRGNSAAYSKEAHFLASCRYESGTNWGQEVGFLYQSVAEDYFTGFTLHCKGWTSVYCSPSRPQFVGTSTTNLNDLLIQGTRWSSGLAEVGFSRFCPLLYGSLRMPILQSMCYAELAFLPLYCLPICIFATIPQICLLNGIAIYPKVSSTYSIVFSLVFVSSLYKHLYEVVASGYSVRAFINEQRMWMIRSVTSHAYGTVDAILKQLGMRKASFLPTNKATDDEQSKRYEMGVYDFQTSIIFLAPMVTAVILNVASFVGGMTRVLVLGDWDKLLLQMVLALFATVMSYPVIEGMILRTDKGRVPPSVTLVSTVISSALLYLGSYFLGY